MLQFELLDETFDLNQTHSYHLSIQADLDGFLFSILDSSAEKYLGLKQYAFEDLRTNAELFDAISGILNEDPLLHKAYSTVSCIHPDQRSTMLPAALFDKEQLKSYFEFNHPLKELDELHYNYLSRLDAYLIFPIYHEISNLYLQSWVNAGFFHPVSILAEEALGQRDGVVVSIQFSGNHFDILATEGQSLKLHNSFSYRSDEDLLYFILFIFDKLGLEQAETPVLLSGNIDKFKDTPAFLKPYFKKLIFRPAPSGFRYPPAFDRIQEHIYLNVFKVYHCG